MEHPKKPERYSNLHDPKLPVIHGHDCGNRAESRVRPSPRPQDGQE